MKHQQHNQDFRFNEILFEGRNKQYGAYVLRNESDRILTKALFMGVSLLAAISITPLVISAFKTEPSIHVPTDGPPVIIKLDRVDRPDNPPVKVEPVKPVSPPNVKQFDNTVPTPTKDAVEPIKQNIPKDATAGLVDNFKGDVVNPNTYVPPTPIIGNGPITAPVQPVVVPKKDPNEIEIAAVEASFEGGIESFRNKVMNKFDGSGFSSDDVMKTMVTFIVERDGTISGIKADGKDTDFNSEALRTIKAVKGKWIPGKNKKGEAVRSYFKFPISMKFEN